MLLSWARQTWWIADVIFPSKDGRARKHVLNGLKIGPDPLAAMEGEKMVLCLSQSLPVQEDGILERPRATANSTSVPLRAGCFDGSSGPQALSKRAGYGTCKPKHHPSLLTFRPVQAQTALPIREGMRERVTDGGH